MRVPVVYAPAGAAGSLDGVVAVVLGSAVHRLFFGVVKPSRFPLASRMFLHVAAIKPRLGAMPGNPMSGLP